MGTPVAAVMVLSTLLLLPALAHAIPDPQSHEPGPGGCAEGWVDAFVLGMGCLYLLQEPLPWEDAGNTCKSLGGQLVEIDNEEQLAFLQQDSTLQTEPTGQKLTTGGLLLMTRHWRVIGC